MKKIISLVLLVVGSGLQASQNQRDLQPCYVCDDVEDEDVFYNAFEFDKCPVCVEEKMLDAELNCGHKFCAPCMMGSEDGQGWLNSHTTCPLCRTVVKTINGENVIVPLGGSYKNPRNHIFYFDLPQDREIIASQYHQQVEDFIHALQPEEYTALIDKVGDEPGHLENYIGFRVYYSDPEFLPLDQRIALLREELEWPMRPDYQGPEVAVLQEQLSGCSTTPEADDLFRRNGMRHTINQQAFAERYPEALNLPQGEFLGDSYSINDDDSEDEDDQEDNN